MSIELNKKEFYIVRKNRPTGKAISFKTDLARNLAYSSFKLRAATTKRVEVSS